MKGIKILIIEDDQELVRWIQDSLSSEGYLVDCSTDGEDGLFRLLSGTYDLVVLDCMLPKMDGAQVVRCAREKGVATPVIMTTALGMIEDRVKGLDAGADDYLVKPFDIRELSARIRALARRPHEIKESEYHYKDIVLFPETLKMRGDLGSCALTKKEMELLCYFIQNAEKTLSRELLYTRIWGVESEVEDASIDIYLHYVRRHLESVSRSVCITTLRRVGYRMEKKHD